MLPGTDLDDVWDRFEVFEALHHNTQICNPMTSAELDEVVQAMGMVGGQRVLDNACGYGELLLRACEQAEIIGTGIDLSPWMIAAAHATASERAPDADLTWVLGDAAEFTIKPTPDACVCIGAEWVWHDFSGTTRAMANCLGSGGVAVIGAARLHLDADPAQVAAERGRVETVGDMHAILDGYGFDVEHRVDPDDAGWDEYLDRTAVAAQQWAARHPGARSKRWIDEQADWHQARERDREVIGWSVMVARKR